VAEVSIGGISFKGGKMMAIVLALSSAVGALYGGFEMYKRFQDMSAAIEAYQEPDLSGFDKKIALVESETQAQMEIVLQKVEGLKSELDIVLEEINLISQVSRELKDDLKTDLRSVEGDVRHITEIVNDVEDRQKEDSRELIDEMKLLEESLDLKIDKALNNPLSGMSAKN
jgi:signal transduction histidine kinase|tara:strand:- start:1367 stop:1879 length:513 start_codon:yes stop_codon:yes gene_type:complete